MLLNIDCPVELLRVEQIPYEGGKRRQAYLTILNESDRKIVRVEGILCLKDVSGVELARRAMRLGELHLEPGRRGTCQMAVDGFELFDDAEAIIRRVCFAEGPDYVAEEPEEVEPPTEPEGLPRNALIAKIGREAFCYPERRENAWVCVCGRFNRLEWAHCRRCARARDEMLDEITPERMTAEYAENLERIRAGEQEAQQAEEEQNAQRRARARDMRRKRRHRQRLLRRVAAGLAALALLLAVALGVRWMLSRSNDGDSPGDPLDAPTPQAALSVDYLQASP